VQEEDPSSSSGGEVCDPTSEPSKRRKLMDVLGVEEGATEGGKWAAAQARFEWLLPSKIKDAKGRRPDHPLYDKRTLFIPHDVLAKMTASQRQYWTSKSKYMDTVLFFKVVCSHNLDSYASKYHELVTCVQFHLQKLFRGILCIVLGNLD
jgi:hypothetical protein